MKKNIILILFFGILISLTGLINPKQGFVQTVTEQQQKENQLNNKKDILRPTQEILQYLRVKKISTRGAREGGEIEGPSEPLRLKVPFDYDSAILKPSAKQQLDELGKALQSPEVSSVRIELAGHTDSRGTAEYNLELSSRRIKSALDYLLDNYQIDPARIHAVGYGKSRPLVPNAKNEAEHAANRRVEIRPLNENESNEDTFEQNSEEIGCTPPKSFKFQFGGFHILEGNNIKLIDYNGTSVLNSRDKYRLYVHPESSCYMYIYQVDSKGNGAVLFPRKDITDQNPLSPNDYWFPSRDKSFSLDETVGIETIYVCVSYKRVDKLENIMISQNNPSSEVVKEIKTRGMAGIQPGTADTEGREESVQITGESQTKSAGLKIGRPASEINVNKPSQDVGKFKFDLNNFDFYYELTFGHE